jgi:uncharacterized membrane protein
MQIRQTGSLIHVSDPLSNAQLFWVTLAATIVVVLAAFGAFIIGAKRQSPDLARGLNVIFRQFAIGGAAVVVIIAVLPCGNAYRSTTVDIERRTVSIGRSIAEYVFMIAFYNRIQQIYRFDEIKDFEIGSGCLGRKSSCQRYDVIRLIAKGSCCDVTLTGRDQSSRKNPIADAEALAILRRALRS